MFTLDQIKAVHAQVKSGADFPNYVQQLKQMGVARYAHTVSDGRVTYHAFSGETVQAPAKWPARAVAETSHAEKLKADLKAHQQGLSGYPEFCLQAAEAGIQQWVVDMEQLTCIYSDKAGHTVLVEKIPA